ncbi:hypothetical protein [Hyella patelloides]|nr:hypothetical protein [Hyella patelloides]
MKILLQTEATKISNRELENNQQYLIGLIDRFSCFPGNLSKQKIGRSKK